MTPPLTQAIIQHRVVSLKHNNSIKPSLGKEITTMVVHYVPSSFHQILKLITNLQNQHSVIGHLTNTMHISYALRFFP
jgi:hypothetical protein